MGGAWRRQLRGPGIGWEEGNFSLHFFLYLLHFEHGQVWPTQKYFLNDKKKKITVIRQPYLNKAAGKSPATCHHFWQMKSWELGLHFLSECSPHTILSFINILRLFVVFSQICPIVPRSIVCFILSNFLYVISVTVPSSRHILLT